MLIFDSLEEAKRHVTKPAEQASSNISTPTEEISSELPISDTTPINTPDVSAPAEAGPAPIVESEVASPSIPTESGISSILPKVFDGILDNNAVQNISTAQRPQQPTPFSPEMNTLPVTLPPGTTPIHPGDYPTAVQLLANSFPSMSQTGIVLDPSERSAYAISVMSNQNLRSDLKAQLIDQVMRDGKIVPEALGKDWYEARNLNLRSFTPPQGG